MKSETTIYNRTSYTEEYLEAERQKILKDPDGYMQEIDKHIGITLDKWITDFEETSRWN